MTKSGKKLRLFQNNKWKLCVVCEAVTPPRAWHCNICNVCVLKREHHCMFVGYCVGHKVTCTARCNENLFAMVRLHYGESNVKLSYSVSQILPNIGEQG